MWAIAIPLLSCTKAFDYLLQEQRAQYSARTILAVTESCQTRRGESMMSCTSRYGGLCAAVLDAAHVGTEGIPKSSTADREQCLSCRFHAGTNFVPPRKHLWRRLAVWERQQRREWERPCRDTGIAVGGPLRVPHLPHMTLPDTKLPGGSQSGNGNSSGNGSGLAGILG